MTDKEKVAWKAMTDKEKAARYALLHGGAISDELMNLLVIGNLNNDGGHVHLEGTNTIDNLRNCGTLTLQQGEDGGVTTIHQYEKEHNCKVTNVEKDE